MSVSFSIKPKTYKLVCGVINKYLKNPKPEEDVKTEIYLCCARNTSEAVVALLECDEPYSLNVGKDKPCGDCYDNLRVRYLDKADGAYKYMKCSKDIDLYIKAI